MTVRRRASGPRRILHPLAWWLWALGLAVAAFRTTNPLLLVLIATVTCLVVVLCRSDAPWSRSLGLFLRLGVLVIVIRVVIQIVFGNRLPGHVWFTLPSVELPSWAQGVSIGGPVTAEAVVSSFLLGLRLAVILVCFGAANSLASPYRLLRCLPSVLYETGVAVTVALAFAPELVISIQAVREARRLRGRPVRGLAGVRGLAVPVLESALDRSLQLASAMDSRGYGRNRKLSAAQRRLTTMVTAAGLLLVVAGVYGVLAPGSLPLSGLPFVALGAAGIVVGLVLSGRRSIRTRYRPDVWGGPEWITAVSAVIAVVAYTLGSRFGTGGLTYSAYPLAWPTLPLVPMLGTLAGFLPALVAPVPDRPRRLPRTGSGPRREDDRGSRTGTASVPTASLPTASLSTGSTPVDPLLAPRPPVVGPAPDAIPAAADPATGIPVTGNVPSVRSEAVR